MLFSNYIELYSVLFSSLLILAYYLGLNFFIQYKPHLTVYPLNQQMRTKWVKMIIEAEGKDILAVQTLRNSVMAANFMASTSVLLIIGTLNLVEKYGFFPNHNLTETVLPHSLSEIKLGLLLLAFSIAFVCFSMAIRFFNHVGYMINLAKSETNTEDFYQQTCAYLNQAGKYYALGNRVFFFCLPIIFWFFGPYHLIIATILLIIGLIMLDKKP